MKLSILIPHLKSYDPYFKRLKDVLEPQMTGDVQLLVFQDEGQKRIGDKRNWLLDRASGDYVCFIDSDDMISPDYIKLLMKGIKRGVDCCSLLGEYSVEGKFDGLFEHSIKYRAYQTVTGARIKYERYPNHLNCIKASIAKQFKFPSINHGEDTDWATQIFKSGLIKTEHYISEVLYYYLWRKK